jgi:hypothetical protein
MKTAVLHVRVTPELLDMIKIAASAEGLGVTAWVTRLLTIAAKKSLSTA